MNRQTLQPARHRLLTRIFVLSLGVCAGLASAATLPEATLDDFYQRWLTGTSAWMLEAEREAFETLADDQAREVFIRRFWQARTASQPGGNDRLLARWQLNLEEALHRFDSLDDERAQALLMAGKPARVVVFPGCRAVVRPLRVWSYEGWHGQSTEVLAKGDQRDEPDGGGMEEGFHLVFWLDGGTGGRYRLWSPDAGATPLIFDGPARHHPWSIEEAIDYTNEKGCFRFSRGDAGRVAAALRAATGPDQLRRMALPPPPDLGWLDRLQAELAGDLSAVLPAAVEIHFPGSYQRKTVVRGRVTVPAAVVGRNAEGLLFDRIVITGDVKLGDRLVDAFRVVHLVAGAAPEAHSQNVEAGSDDVEALQRTIVLDFYRRLRPGAYSLSLRVEDADGLGLLREVRALEVPVVVDEAPPLKRSRHQAMGRVFPVRKRACHVTIDLDIPGRPAAEQ